MRVTDAGQGPEHDVSKVIAVPPGSDQVSSAVRYITELQRQGVPAKIIVGGKVLSRYVRSQLPFEARGRGVIVSRYYLQKLWQSTLGTPYILADEYSPDLWEFRSQLIRATSRRTVEQEHVIVLHGQQFSIEFYELLRLLNIPAAVYVDSVAVVGDNGSTLRELTRTLGVSAPSVLRGEARTTTHIYDFFSHLYTLTSQLSSSRPNRPGERPLLWHHETIDDEIQFVADYVKGNPRISIGLLVPLADMVDTFRKTLAAKFGDVVQWHLAGSQIPRAHQVDFRRTGLKILTWASALGVQFDTVILAGLHYANHGQSNLRLATTLQMLTASARKHLVLSYSGPGDPPSLNLLPKHLLEFREASTSVTRGVYSSSLDHTAVTKELIPPALVVSDLQCPNEPVQRSSAEIARSLLAEARDKKSARRVLTAEEEVGLAQLMRGVGADLSIELPRGFRATVAPDDERATAFDAMVTHNDGLVWSIVRTYAGTGMADEDLYQHGIFGLMRAIEKFDASRGTKFSTYGTRWIQQTINRGIANEGATIRLPVHVREAINKVNIARNRLLAQRGHASIAAISHDVGLTPDKVAEYLRLSAGVMSLDAPLRDEPDLSIVDLITATSGELAAVDEIIDRQTVIRRVRKALDRLKDRDSLVLRLRFGFDGEDELTLDQIGKRIGLTRERIRQIEKKAKGQLIYELTQLGNEKVASRDAEQPPSRLAPQPTPGHTLRQVPAIVPSSVERSGQEDFYVERLGNGIAYGSRRDLLGNPSATSYSLKAWLTSLIDYGLASHSSRIIIRSNYADTFSWLAFVHDGEPSIWTVIQDCKLQNFSKDSIATQLRPVVGSAINLFDEIIAWPSCTIGNVNKPVVLATARTTDSWWLFEGAGPAPPAVQEASSSERHSVVVFRGPVRSQAAAILQSIFKALRVDLGLTLGYLLRADRVTLAIGDQEVTPRDPFLERNPAAQNLGIEQITAGGYSALVNPRVLPHPSKLLSGESYSAGNPATWECTQGFYIRCARRYLAWGSWLGLDGLDTTAATALARVAVEIEPEDLETWGLSHPGMSATPPEPLRRRLSSLAGIARRRSEQVLADSP